MEFVCSECDYTSETKRSVLRHINKKNKCGENPQIVEVPVEIRCEHCDKQFTTKPSLKRHYRSCKVLKSEKDAEINELQSQIAELKTKLAAKPQPININIQQNNIIVNGYNNTDMSKITDRHFNAALNKTLMSVPKLIEMTHFNPKMPENHNIYINNFKSKYAMVYDGGDWCIKDQNETINKLIDDQEYALEDWVSKTGEQDPKVIDKFQRYLNVKEKDGAEEAMKEEVRMMLYNKRKIVKK